MTIKKADTPAMPQDDATWCQRIGDCPTITTDLTKREMFCLHMGVAETGDAELDAIIREGNRQKIAAQIMCGLLSAADNNGEWTGTGANAEQSAAKEAGALLAELEKTA